MAHESRPPQREGDEANPKNGIEAEGFAQNQQELEEIRQALTREADEEETKLPTPPQTIPEREPVRARIERPLLTELVHRTIRELSRGNTLPTEQKVEQDISRLLHNRSLRPQEQRVIRELLIAAERTSPSAASPEDTQGAPHKETPFRTRLPAEKQQELEGQYRKLLFSAADPKLVRALMLAYKAGQEANGTTFRDILQGMGSAEIRHLALAFQAGEAISGQYRTAEQQYVTLLMQSTGSDTRRLMEANKAGRAGDRTVLETLLEKTEGARNAYHLYLAFQAGEESAGKGGMPDNRKSEAQTTEPPAHGSSETLEAISDSAPEVNVIHTVETQNETADTPEEAAERRQQETARGVTESAESRSETLTPQERLTRLQAKSQDIHPDVLDRNFGRGMMGNQNALRNFFREFGALFDASQKARIIEAYNLGAEMSWYPSFTPETPPGTSKAEPPPSADNEDAQSTQERRTQEPTEEERQEEQKRQEEDERRVEEERKRQRAEEEEDLNFLDKKTREVLFDNLDYTRRAYAEAEVRVDKIKGDATAEIMEAERMRSAYRGAINAIRDYYQRHIAADALLSPEQKAQRIHGIILETTAREANRLFNLKTDIKIKEREEAAKEQISSTETKSYLGKTLFTSVEFAKQGGRLALRSAQAYRNLPIKYKLLLSGVLAGGSITAGALALPTLAIGLGLGVSIQRILGGGAAAIGVEAWRHKKQEKKSEEEVAREIERQGDLLTALLRANNQERLNDLMFQQAGRKGLERNKRMALAGLTFAAIATGLSGAGIRTGATYLAQSETAHAVMSFLGIPDNLKDRVWAGADGIKKSAKEFFFPKGTLEAAETQNTGAPTPATEEGLGAKIKRGILSVVGADNPEELSRPAGGGSTVTENAPDKQLRPGAETKPDTAPNKSPAQETQPAQPAGKERWDAIEKKWVPAEPAAEKPSLVPTNEGTKTAPPRAAVTEAPPKTPAAEKQPPQSTRTEAGAPKTAAEIAARARAMELVTVRKGEGAWQAVRRQFYDRMRTEPQKFGMTPEDAAKLPEDIDKLGKGTKAAKLLNRETLKTLKEAGYINPDGTTKVGIAKSGVRIFLNPDNSIGLQGEGKLTYEPAGQRSKAGTAPERTGRPRGGATESSGRTRTRGALPQERGSVRQSFDLNKEPPLQELKARLEDASSYDGRTLADKVQAANLKEFGLNPQEFKNISEMKVKAFIDEMNRNEMNIRHPESRGARPSKQIFINKGPFTTRGFSADIADARKYLDISERLEKYMKPFDKATRQAILKEPVGKLLRALSFEK